MTTEPPILSADDDPPTPAEIAAYERNRFEDRLRRRYEDRDDFAGVRAIIGTVVDAELEAERALVRQAFAELHRRIEMLENQLNRGWSR